MASKFREGARAAGHTVTWFNLFDDGVEDLLHKELVAEADHLNFTFPCWWEMPPAKLVEYFQTVFVKGFAFDFESGVRKVLLNKDVSVFISLGQFKDYNTTNLKEAMEYCGLRPRFWIANGVGPGMMPETVEQYTNLAYRTGQHI
jgi:putative NADPH-quinone reductase